MHRASSRGRVAAIVPSTNQRHCRYIFAVHRCKSLCESSLDIRRSPFRRSKGFAQLLLPALFAAALCVCAASARAQVVISEFMAGNSRTLSDEDGDSSDWIELYNSGAEIVDLSGWFLTDDLADLRKWRFPRLLISPNQYAVIFASGKNRGHPESELHTNFRLSASGDSLALIGPDGVTVELSFSPEYPPQFTDVSFGFAMREEITRLITPGATAKLLAPSNEAHGSMWTEVEWPDTDWVDVRLGIGFDDTNAPPTLLPIADSTADFSGVQGENRWFYGYYNRTADAEADYQSGDFMLFPSGAGPHSPANFWNGGSWDWYDGDPPWTEIAARIVHPNGTNSGAEHWPIRRWISPVSGTVTVQWRLAKETSGGTGVTGRLFHRGTQKEQAVIAGANVTGINRRSILLNVEAGDPIDFALAPVGSGGGTDDRSDRSYFSATISVTNAFAAEITSDVRGFMSETNSGVYVRIPFVAIDPGRFEFLTLRIKYDDGFVAYLNGVEVARRNVPDELSWDSFALTSRDLPTALQTETINLSDRLGLLQSGTNLLAIHALNASDTDPDLLLVPELIASSMTLNTGAAGYFSASTPGRINGAGTSKLGPLVLDVAHAPQVPSDADDLIVTARAVPTAEPVGELKLSYRVMFGAEIELPMLDDGKHGDGAANDGTYGAIIPASASGPGQIVRYSIDATDSSGTATRSPAYSDPLNSPQYHGTMVADPSVTSALPILYWFIQNPRGADSETGTRSIVFFNGKLYDNIGVNLHGQSSASFPKKSYDFDFHPGHHFEYSPEERPVEDFNLLTTYPDKSHMRNLLAYETYRDAGSPYHIAFPIRVQQNGAFYSHAHFVEDGDADYLERVGLDPYGALYKMYNTLNSSTSGVEKKTRKHESNADLQALITGLRRTGAARTRFIYDNVNIPAMVNYLAAMIITGGVDCCHKNYYAYRDTNGSGEWQYLPWDVDLTFGRNWNSANTYFDDTMFTSNPLFVGGNNALISALFNTPAIRQMYLRRIRTLMDELLQPTNTPPAELKYERRIDELFRIIEPEAALDFSKWTTWGRRQTLPQALDILTNQYFPRRRTYLYSRQEIPRPQPRDATVEITQIDFNPASGNQAEEYIQITNTNSVALDISGWMVAGAVSHSFHPGTVLPARSAIYLSPNPAAFRARSTEPSGGGGLLVQGNYKGQLSARGEPIRVLDAAGRQAAILTYTGAPTAAQLYLRIVELMYHPPLPPAGSPFAPEEFEFVQLKNTGPFPLDISGVQFSDGIRFRFGGGQVNLLMPGDSVYVAKNPAAFESRYGRVFTVAGPYEGYLDNSGETLRLDDASGEKVLDFSYDNAWYPAADGGGYSLVIADENGLWNSWDEKARWQISPLRNGSPAAEPASLTIWKRVHFNPQELSDPKISGDLADSDSDGRSNLDEYISGTNPRDPASYLKLEAPQLESLTGQGTVRFHFTAVQGKAYSVQFADSVVSPVWQKLQDVPAGPERRVIEITDPHSGNQRSRYYRVVTPPQP